MTRIFVPSSGPDAWRGLLADPEKHWAPRYSARTLAHCWEHQDGFPPEIQAVLAQVTALADAEPLLIFPEWKVNLVGGTRPSQNDVWVLAKGNEGLISMAIEGKVKEPFDKTVAEWRIGASPGKQARLAFLFDVLGLASPTPDSVRYQLLHRAASAVIEADRFGARHAVMLVHSFSSTHQWFEDFAAFVGLYGRETAVGELVTVQARAGLPLHLAWVQGHERFLEA